MLFLYYKKTTGHETPLSVNIGIGAKHSSMPPAMNVDYIFMFHIDDSVVNKTVIHYNVAIINTRLLKKFAPLTNTQGKMIGTIELDKIYIIN